MSSAARAAEVTAGQIYEESARQLARWRDRYRGRPERERRRLWLLALEREQVVSIAYRESAIADRIARMPLAEEVRVPEMDESAFPPLTPPPALVRIVRRAAQLAFGLRPPA
jgi:translation elongation factor EF-Tu-like GTPase